MTLEQTKTIDCGDGYKITLSLTDFGFVMVEVSGPQWEKVVRTRWDNCCWSFKDLPKAFEKARNFIEKRKNHLTALNQMAQDLEAIVEIEQIAATL